MDAETVKAARKRLAGLWVELDAAYTLVSGILASLPIPMGLAAKPRENTPQAVADMSRAWEMASWEPLPSLTIGRIRDMITAFQTAYELTVLATASGPSPQRLRGIDAALLAARTAAADIERHLNGDFTAGQSAPEAIADFERMYGYRVSTTR